MTATSEGPVALTGLPGALADIALWTTYALQHASDDDIDLQMSAHLQKMIAAALQNLDPRDRLAFVEHAAARAEQSGVVDYQMFLLDVAESLGLE